jgi:hypothetical protein
MYRDVECGLRYLMYSLSGGLFQTEHTLHISPHSFHALGHPPEDELESTPGGSRCSQRCST